METLVLVGLDTGSIGTRHLSVIWSLPEVRGFAIPVRLKRRAELAQAGTVEWLLQDLDGAHQTMLLAEQIAMDAFELSITGD